MQIITDKAVLYAPCIRCGASVEVHLAGTPADITCAVCEETDAVLYATCPYCDRVQKKNTSATGRDTRVIVTCELCGEVWIQTWVVKK